MRSPWRILVLAVPLVLFLGVVAVVGGRTNDAGTPADPTGTPPAATAAAAEPSATATPGPDDIVGTLGADPRFSVLSALLGQSGLADTLAGVGPFTVFAPTDDAFAALPPGTLDAVKADPVLTRRLLAYHVVAGRLPDDALAAGSLVTAEGQPVTVAVDGAATVNGAAVTAPPTAAANGVVHIVAAVLLPSDLGLTPTPPQAAPPG